MCCATLGATGVALPLSSLAKLGSAWDCRGPPLCLRCPAALSGAGRWLVVNGFVACSALCFVMPSRMIPSRVAAAPVLCFLHSAICNAVPLPLAALVAPVVSTLVEMSYLGCNTLSHTRVLRTAILCNTNSQAPAELSLSQDTPSSGGREHPSQKPVEVEWI